MNKPRLLTVTFGTLAIFVWLFAFVLLAATPDSVVSPNQPTKLAIPTQVSSDTASIAQNPIEQKLAQAAAVITEFPMQPARDEMIIQFHAGTSQEERNAYIASFGGTVTQTIAPLNSVTVQVPSGAILPPSPLVAVSEPDYLVSALLSIPTSDPYYADQWALNAIGLPQAWLNLPAELPTITVAVIDSGICADHSDLVGRIVAGRDFVEKDNLPQDEFGHGCAVAGIISANADNAVGIAGVAPNANIMPLRVLDKNGLGTYSNVVAAMVYAADNGAQIINLSLGGTNQSVVLESAVNYAINKGVTVIAAAGNTGQPTVLYPAAYQNVIAVGSVDANLQHSAFSSYGAQVDVYAPGNGILTTDKSGGYGAFTGTSFAAPHVAGVAAIELAQGRTLVTNGGVLKLSNSGVVADESSLDDTVTAQATCSLTQITNTTANNSFSIAPYISDDGLRIAFSTAADVLGTGETGVDVYLWDQYADFQIIEDPFSLSNENLISGISGDGTAIAFFTGQGVAVAFDVYGDWRSRGIFEADNLDNPAKLSQDSSRLVFASSENIQNGNPDENMEIYFWGNGSVSGFTQITDTASGTSDSPSIDASGTRIVFRSTADLVTGSNSDGSQEIFLWDEIDGFTQITSTTGRQFNTPAISRDGSHIVFTSNANLSGNNADGNFEIFAWDVANGFTQITNSTTSNSFTNQAPTINGDGSIIAFHSDANLTGGNSDGSAEIFQWIEGTGLTQLTSSTLNSLNPQLNANGKRIAFSSQANLTGGNADNNQEVFLLGCDAAPEIIEQPAQQITGNGGTATLQVKANGNLPLIYQWYQGTVGDTSNPIGANSYRFTTPNLTDNEQYWVRITNAVGSINSANADVNVYAPSPTICSSQTIVDNYPDVAAGTMNGDGSKILYMLYDNASGTYTLYLWEQAVGATELFFGTNFSQLSSDGSRFTFRSASSVVLWDEIAGVSGIANLEAGDAAQGITMNRNGTRVTFESTADLTGNNPNHNPELFLWDEVTGFEQLTTTGIDEGSYGNVDGIISGNGNRVFIRTWRNLDGTNPDLSVEYYLWDETTGITQITNTTDGIFWSPVDINSDGSRLAFVHNSNLSGFNPDKFLELLVWDEGGGFTQITSSTTYYAIFSAMSDDGQTISFASDADLTGNNANHNPELFLWNESFGFAQLTDTIGTDYSFYPQDIDEDGSHILVASKNELTGETTLLQLSCNDAPTIDNEPDDQIISSGDTADLSVTATGDGTLSYQWYQGASGVTSTPVGTNSPTFTTPALTATTQYWVRISNAYGSVDSDTATVTVSFCAGVSEIPLAECLALEALYNSTDGANWTNNDGWLVTNTPCIWYGVTCDMDSHLNRLQLFNNNLVGDLPAELGNLIELEYLLLTSNALTGAIPPEIGNLSSLKVIDLRNNQLSGTIPSTLGSMTNLWELKLSNNQLSGAIPPRLGDLASLSILSISNNQLTGNIPAEMGNLTNLRSLILSSNHLSGAIPSSIGILSLLEGLWLNNNQLSGNIPVELGNLSTLFYLHLENNQLRGVIPTNITNLTLLTSDTDLGYNALYSPNGTVTTFLNSKDADWQNTQTIAPSNVAQTAFTLDSATLSWTPITYTGDGGYYEVSYGLNPAGPYTVAGNTLNKTATTFTINGLSPATTYYFRVRTHTPAHGEQQNTLWSDYSTPIFGSTAAGGFCADVTDIPQSECAAMEAFYTSTNGAAWTNDDGWMVDSRVCSWSGVNCVGGHITGLVLEYRNLSGTIPAEIGNLTSLQTLILNNNRIGGTIPAQIGNLAGLSTLKLEYNQFSGSIPTTIGNLTNLTDLHLEYNQLSGSIPPEIGQLSTTNNLFLNHNLLSGSIPPEIGNLTNLYGLYMHENQLSGSIPASIGDMIGLRFLMLHNNQLTGSIPPELGDLSNLMDLLLNANQLTGSIPPEIGDLSALLWLGLGNNQLSGAIPTEIGNLSNLQILQLESNRFTGSIPTEIGNLLLLQSLFLNNNALTGNVPPSFMALTELGANDNFPIAPYWMYNDEVNIGYNSLSANAPVTTFLNTTDADWRDTQTLAPTNLAFTNITEDSITLTWTPIIYVQDAGFYEISYGTAPGGPFTVLGNTTNKTKAAYVAAGLLPSTTYYFRLRTFTAAHGKQQNALWSDYVTPLSATTNAGATPVPHTIGLFKNGAWLFRDSNSSGNADVSFAFGNNETGWTPLVGDWDGDGIDGIGVYKNGVWLLRNSASSGTRNLAFSFNPLGVGAVPIVGDWDGDGVDGIGVYLNGTWTLKNIASEGKHNIAFTLSAGGTGWIPVIGDWNGDGIDTAGLYKDGTWYLHDSLSTPTRLRGFNFGPVQPGWMPVIGDWNEDGIDTIGLHKDGLWRLRNTNSAGAADIGFNFAGNGTSWMPIAGYRSGVAGLSALGLGSTYEPTAEVVPTEQPEATEESVVVPEVTPEPTETPIATPTDTETASPTSTIEAPTLTQTIEPITRETTSTP